jgi:hypothetical protein
MAEPGTWRGKTAWAYFSSEAGLISVAAERTRFKLKGQRNNPLSLRHPIPGSAMLLKVLGGTSTERRCTGGLSRSGASPYRSFESDDDEHDNS